MRITLTRLEADIIERVCRNNAGIGGTTELNSVKWNHLANKFSFNGKEKCYNEIYTGGNPRICGEVIDGKLTLCEYCNAEHESKDDNNVSSEGDEN